MNPGVERLLTLTFGKEGNETNHLGNGWSGEEPGGRWMIGQGSEFWIGHPGTGHDLVLELDTRVMTQGANPSVQRLIVGVRNKAVAQIVVPRSGVLGFHIPAALLESPGPVRILFLHPDFRRPMDLGTSTDDRQLSFAILSLRLYRIVARPPRISVPEPSLDEMITRFESLGDNCEFGLVQRRLGAEPLGLLRFTFIELADVIRGVRTGFQGLGDPGTAEITISDKDSEYVVRDTSFGMTFHTWQYAHQLDLETAQRQHHTRLGFLKRKFIDDIANSGKIFVIKRTPPLRPEEVLPLYVALNERARNWLLWVVPGDEKHPVGTIEILLPGLLRGFVDRFAPNENAPDLSIDAWTAICEAVWRAVGT